VDEKKQCGDTCVFLKMLLKDVFEKNLVCRTDKETLVNLSHRHQSAFSAIESRIPFEYVVFWTEQTLKLKISK
jgi:hypothetical protein